MGDLSRVGGAPVWGRAEQAAFERCLEVPGLSDRRDAPRPAMKLTRTIETEIIPRLMLAHLEPSPGLGGAAASEISSADVRDFTRTVMEGDAAAITRAVDAVRARGCGLEAIFLQLLASTARLLGDMWRDDLCSFTDVTIGMSRLQRLVRELGVRFEREGRTGGRGRILLASTPGEQHSFGVSMLESFFRRAGWEVFGGATAEPAELIRIAGEEWLDVIGLSLSSDVLYGRSCAAISSLKAASRNPSVFVMVGGRYFCDNPDRASDAGADATASDALDALGRAQASLGFALASC